MNDLMKILEVLGDSNILLKGVIEIVQNDGKEQKGRSLSMLLGTLGTSLLENLLTEKGIYRAGKGKGINRTGEGIVIVALCPLIRKIIKWIFNTTSSFNKL